jgi:hypothetical protein
MNWLGSFLKEIKVSGLAMADVMRFAYQFAVRKGIKTQF